jgi:hypothetical protein
MVDCYHLYYTVCNSYIICLFTISEIIGSKHIVLISVYIKMSIITLSLCTCVVLHGLYCSDNRSSKPMSAKLVVSTHIYTHSHTHTHSHTRTQPCKHTSHNTKKSLSYAGERGPGRDSNNIIIIISHVNVVTKFPRLQSHDSAKY